MQLHRYKWTVLSVSVWVTGHQTKEVAQVIELIILFSSSHTGQKHCTTINIGTISIHSQVKWLYSCHRYLMTPAPIGSDTNMTPRHDALIFVPFRVRCYNTHRSSRCWCVNRSQAALKYHLCWVWKTDWGKRNKNSNKRDLVAGLHAAFYRCLCSSVCVCVCVWCQTWQTRTKNRQIQSQLPIFSGFIHILKTCIYTLILL